MDRVQVDGGVSGERDGLRGVAIALTLESPLNETYSGREVPLEREMPVGGMQCASSPRFPCCQ